MMSKPLFAGLAALGLTLALAGSAPAQYYPVGPANTYYYPNTAYMYSYPPATYVDPGVSAYGPRVYGPGSYYTYQPGIYYNPGYSTYYYPGYTSSYYYPGTVTTYRRYWRWY